MQLKFDIRPALRSCAVAVACAAFSWSAVAADATPPANHEIKDPHYGDTLFQFFQDHYFTSVTELMASQKFERVSHHSDEAEILRGGMLLSYGMHKEAGEIFANLIDHGASPKVRDRAWYFLAKIRYQRGYVDEAGEALAHVENNLPPELQEDKSLLQANLLMARADYANAAGVLSKVTDKAPGARYAQYNLGIALMKSGNPAGGIAVLDKLGQQPAENEEFRSLRDRANVAIGFQALTDNNPKIARTYLERVRLKSLQANKALLGFGWAAAAMKEPKLALVPWTELAERDVNDSAALEARIAVPYAYAELGAFGQSLDRYNEAIATFAKENTDLDESIKAIRTGAMVEALNDRNPGDEMGWFWRMGDLPEMPHAAHLTQVLAQNEFQEAFKNYRDLRFLQRNLDEWHEKLGVFTDMLETRKKAYAERLPQVRARASQIGLSDLMKRRDAVAEAVAKGETEADGIAFADAKQLDLLARIDSSKKLVDNSTEPELVAAKDRVRRAEGAMTWQLAQDFTARVYQARRDLAAIDEQIVAAKSADAALAQAQRDEPAKFDAFAKRIAALDPLLQVMIPRVAMLAKEQQVALQDIAVAELTRQKERLAIYSTQARFAVAQLYDRATVKKEGDHASAK